MTMREQGQARASGAARRRRLSRPFALALMIGLAALAAERPALAQETAGKVIAADDALRLAAAGELVLVDVRSPQEWRQTGVPVGAQPITIHQPDGLVGFVGALRASLGDDQDLAIAVICARGNRSTLAQSALAQAGYGQVLNIREGMFGSPDGPGWLARGLPTDACTGC